MSPLMAERMDSMDCRNERVMGITLTIEQTKISIIQTYAPQQGRSLREKEQFYETLQEMTETIRHHENVIVMGDMNGHVGQNRDGVEHVIGEFSIGERNQEGERIIDYCVMNNMSIMNTYYKHQESHKWTWYRWNAAQQGYTERSMIDLFLTNKKNIFKDVRTIPSVSLDSDHRLVVARLKIVKPKEKVKKKQKRFKLENLKDEEKKQALRQLEEQGENPNEISIEEVKEALKKMRSSKAPGDDELPIELFKAAGEECVEWMRQGYSSPATNPNSWERIDCHVLGRDNYNERQHI
ncbi:craniofacial development protein 2-like [Scylla paramamosain]|uniref:craniofacial development protein 2-like n=1 Tax=Scylla paramamosain TaxID=85552 RepID=UPI00308332A2